MALGWDRAVGPDHMAQPQLAHSSYEHARQQAAVVPGSSAPGVAPSGPSSATTVSIPSASTFLPSRRSGQPMRDVPLPNFPGGMHGPRPLTNVERAVLHREASARTRYARPTHDHGLGRG
jgi:hypothetical protein